MWSCTVTVNEQAASSPEKSLETYSTVETPTGNSVPFVLLDTNDDDNTAQLSSA